MPRGGMKRTYDTDKERRFGHYRDEWDRLLRIGSRLTELREAGHHGGAVPDATRAAVEAQYAETLARIRATQAAHPTPRRTTRAARGT